MNDSQSCIYFQTGKSLEHVIFLNLILGKIEESLDSFYFSTSIYEKNIIKESFQALQFLLFRSSKLFKIFLIF